MKSKKPKYLIAYLCWECNFISYLDDLEKPKCGCCGNENNLLITSKEKHGQKAINKSMKELTKKIIDLLEKDINSGNYDLNLKKEELIEKLEESKKLKKVLEKKKISRKERDKHIINLTGNI